MCKRNHSALRQLLGRIAVLGLLAGCIPTIGRTNAHIEHGWDLNAVGAVGAFTGATDDKGERREANADDLPYLEAQLQYGVRTANHGGFAVQLKAPLFFVLSSLDLYYELPLEHPDFFGVGAEAGLALSSLYLVYTHYFGDSVFVTITPRIHYQYELDDLQRDSYDEHPLDRNNVWLAPQVSLGFRQASGLTEFFAFAAYNHYLGEMEFDLCPIPNDCDDILYAQGMWISGVGLRL